MNSGSQEMQSDEESAWFTKKQSDSFSGLRVADTLDEVKLFAYNSFDRLDKDGDGFISKQELTEAMRDEQWGWREKSYICFLLRRIDDIADAYDEEWCAGAIDGVSRGDIQEYFKVIRSKISGGK